MEKNSYTSVTVVSFGFDTNVEYLYGMIIVLEWVFSIGESSNENEKSIVNVPDYLTYDTMDLRRIFDTIMNMDQRIRFVGVLDKNATII